MVCSYDKTPEVLGDAVMVVDLRSKCFGIVPESSFCGTGVGTTDLFADIAGSCSLPLCWLAQPPIRLFSDASFFISDTILEA